MIHKFKPSSEKNEKKIELRFSQRKLITVINYPDADPRDRIADEYEEDEQIE